MFLTGAGSKLVTPFTNQEGFSWSHNAIVEVGQSPMKLQESIQPKVKGFIFLGDFHLPILKAFLRSLTKIYPYLLFNMLQKLHF